jgi:hypothetical protein
MDLSSVLKVLHPLAMRCKGKLFRLIAVIAPMLLAACSGGPQALGITGPGQSPMPVAVQNNAASPVPNPVPDASPRAGAPTTGTFYGPNNGPTSGNGNFYGYN